MITMILSTIWKIWRQKKVKSLVLCRTLSIFVLDIDRNIFVGAVNIRHYLNESLYKSGGHIGDGIRPSERRKGLCDSDDWSGS